MTVPISERLRRLPPYLFAAMDAAKRKAREAGIDVVDLGVGDPDQPTPALIRRAMHRAVDDPANHRYALDQGMPALRAAIAAWYQKRFGVSLDPDTEILPLIGSKEGISHLPLGLLNPGDRALVPDPGYPPYGTGTILAGGIPARFRLRPELDFLPDLGELEQMARVRRTKLLFLNYPNNPTGAVASPSFFRDTVRLAQRHGLLVAHDAAYSELAFDGAKPPSFLQTPGAKSVGVEFHSLSKTFNMTGWRIGWACGNAAAIAALAKVKLNIDSGIFQAVQVAGVAALKAPASLRAPLLAMYARRRNLLIAGLRRQGWPVAPPTATFYVWARLPRGLPSTAAAHRLLTEGRVIVTPGIGFGAGGEGYVRMALTVPEPRLREAIRRISRVNLWPSRMSGSART
ncbi:MAG: LL-diaminopimelate aminotransferase [Candidatus Omnitrophica bacterium]|nr:LL-diaminopimelate aminotransferase [Candidatus Omnitrophota bacterium]